MAVTLTQAAKGTKLSAKIVLAAFLLFLVFKVGSDIYRAIFPKSPEVTLEPPTFAFGKLPLLRIEAIALSTSPTKPPTLSLDLVTTTLPETPHRVPIYTVLKAPYGFLALDRAKQLAGQLDFAGQPQSLTPIDYLWSAPNRKLEMDTQNLNFNYEYNYKTDSSVFVPGQFLSQKAGLQTAIDVLRSKNLLGGGTAFEGARGQDLENGEKTVELLKFQEGQLVSTTSLAQASAVRVDFFRTPINETPIVSPKFKQSLVNILISGQRNDPAQQRYTQILKLDYTYWVINRKESATYAINTAQFAWEELQRDPSFFVYLGPEDKRPQSPTLESFTVNQVYLAYYDSAQYQPYLQPVWVFEGKATLGQAGQVEAAAYVPALPTEWVAEE